MFQKLKYIWVVGSFVVGMQSSYAQVATNIVTPPLPTADVPVHYAVPELTGNAEQDAGIQQVRSRRATKLSNHTKPRQTKYYKPFLG